jgi:hypothetical protein
MQAASCVGAGQVRPGGGTPFLFGRGAGMVRLGFENASGGGTVPVGKCVRSQYGFHSAKRPVVVQVKFRAVVGSGSVSITGR